MIALEDNATYIENITSQDAGDNDWAVVENTTIGYIPKELDMLATSNTSNLEVITAVRDRVPVVNDKLITTDTNNIISEIVAGAVTYNGKLLTLLDTFQSSDTQTDDQFGIAAAISNDGLACVVSAPYTGTGDNGAIYTFKRNTVDDAWTEIGELSAIDGNGNDHFGSSVAISDDGLVCIVGAQGQDTTATNAGKVYTYKRYNIEEHWGTVNTLQPSDVAQDYNFGVSTALSSDGLVCLVGALGSNANNGRVYTFKRATIGDAWTELNSFQSSDKATGDYFGMSTALSSDGLVCLVGAMQQDTTATNAGKVYTYKRATIDDAWTEVNMFQSSDIAAGDYFGVSVALSDDGLVCLVGSRYANTITYGSGLMYTFKRATIDNAWTEVNVYQATNNMISFGNCQEYLVSASGGKVYNYGLNKTYSIDVSGTNLTAVPIRTFYNDDVDVSVSLEPTSDRVSSLDRTLTKVSSTTSQFVGTIMKTKDMSLATEDIVVLDGTNVSITGATAIETYVSYLTNPVLINSFQSSDITKDDYFGTSVALSSDGLVCIVGATYQDTTAANSGKVYTYKRATIDNVWIEINMLQSSDIAASDLFGTSVALSGDGLVCLVGASRQDTTASNAGKVYTYKRDTINDAWTEVNMFQSSDIAANDYFGASTALSGDGLVCLVGAYGQDTTAPSAGKVYTYKRATINDAWTEVNSFQSSDIAKNDYFGASAALSGDGLVCLVGANLQDTTAPGAGKVYTFKRATINDTWTEVNSFQSSDIAASDYFGNSVAISSDGLVCLVGAAYKNTTASKAGAVYVFERATVSDDWGEVSKIVDPKATADDHFGYGCSISRNGDIALVGTWGNAMSNSKTRNRAYTFKLGELYTQHTLEFGALSAAPTTAIVPDRSVKLTKTSTLYNGTKFTITFNSLIKQGRAIQRKIVATKKDMVVLEPLSSDLQMLN